MPKYMVTKGDFNDVFERTELEFSNDDSAELYAIQSILDLGYTNDQIEDIGSTDICKAVYMPVVDDDGNALDSNDPRYEKFSEEQEPRIEYYVEVSSLED